MVWYHDFDPVAIKPVASAFEAHYKQETGEELNLELNHQSGGELRAQVSLEMETGGTEADIISVAHMTMAGLQSEFDMFGKELVDEVSNPAIPENLRDPLGDGSAVPVSVQPYLLVYNTDAVSESEAPAEWSDLLDERWTNQIGMGDVETTSSSHLYMWFLVDYLGSEVGEPFGWSFYESLSSQNVTVASSHDTIMQYIVQGELELGVLGLAQTISAINEGQDISGVVPETGAPSQILATAIPKETGNGDVARMLAEWLVSVEGQEAVYEGYPAFPVRDDVETAKMPFDISGESLVPVDASWVNNDRTEHIERVRSALG